MPTLLVGVRRSRHSNKEKSGFTHAYNVEPVTFRPHENHTGDLPGNVTWRPTGDSVMKKSFQRPSYLKVSVFSLACGAW